ncbi:hypothetical protein P7C71_g5736, partial [Lecanoromycetidae sp. Uapishka_2]
MAYNSGYNPDALPAHAEPEQAAQILSSQQQHNQSNQPDLAQSQQPQRPYSHSNPQPYNPPYQAPQQQHQRPTYQSKPPPPLPQQVQQLQPQPPARLSPNHTYNNTHSSANASP